MKLSQVKVKVITDAVAANFESAILTFLRSGAEQTFLDLQIMVNGTTYVAVITYTE